MNCALAGTSEKLVADGFYFVVFDEDDGVGPEFAVGVPEVAEFDGFEGVGGGGLGGGERGEEEEGKQKKRAKIFHLWHREFWICGDERFFSSFGRGMQRGRGEFTTELAEGPQRERITRELKECRLSANKNPRREFSWELSGRSGGPGEVCGRRWG